MQFSFMEKIALHTLVRYPFGPFIVRHVNTILFYYGRIAFIWSTQDLQKKYPFLTEEQAMKLLEDGKACTKQIRVVVDELIDMFIREDFPDEISAMR